MASQRDIELASLLYRSGIVTQQEIEQALGHQGRLLTEGVVKSLIEVLVEKKLVPASAAATFTDEPLQDVQPIKNYVIADSLGDGASARVFKATYVPKDLEVALKILHAEQVLQRKPFERFVREAKLLCRLRHDNLVKGYECKKVNGWVYLAMELVDGGTILERIDQKGHLDGKDSLFVVQQIAKVLDYLYGQGIVHRDIKPGNILVDDLWRVKLIDLGLCRMKGQAEESEGTTVGTVGYISPEQAKGIDDLDIRSDIYSLGVTLYHMVSGEVPFSGDTDLEVMGKQIMQALRSDRLKKLNISPHVHFTIEKMMAKDRDMRFQSPKEVVDSIGQYLESIDYEPIPIARPVVSPDKPTQMGSGPGKHRSSVKPGAPISRRRRRRFR